MTGVLVKGLFKPGDVITNEQAVIAKIKNLFSRDKNTDHYAGLFNVFLWNDGVAIHKRGSSPSALRSASIMAATSSNTPS